MAALNLSTEKHPSQLAQIPAKDLLNPERKTPLVKDTSRVLTAKVKSMSAPTSSSPPQPELRMLFVPVAIPCRLGSMAIGYGTQYSINYCHSSLSAWTARESNPVRGPSLRPSIEEISKANKLLASRGYSSCKEPDQGFRAKLTEDTNQTSTFDCAKNINTETVQLPGERSRQFLKRGFEEVNEEEPITTRGNNIDSAIFIADDCDEPPFKKRKQEVIVHINTLIRAAKSEAEQLLRLDDLWKKLQQRCKGLTDIRRYILDHEIDDNSSDSNEMLALAIEHLITENRGALNKCRGRMGISQGEELYENLLSLERSNEYLGETQRYILDLASRASGCGS